MDENFYGRMYGSRPSQNQTKAMDQSAEKRATRVLGGMKAQNSHVKTVDLNGELVSFPRAEYVKVLEDQIKQMRVTVRELENTNQRYKREFNKVYDMLRTIQQDLANKVDLR